MAGKPRSDSRAGSRRTRRAVAVALGGVAAAGAGADPAAAMLPPDAGGAPAPNRTPDDGPVRSGHPTHGQTRAPAPAPTPPPHVQPKPPPRVDSTPPPTRANPTVNKPKVQAPGADDRRQPVRQEAPVRQAPAPPARKRTPDDGPVRSGHPTQGQAQPVAPVTPPDVDPPPRRQTDPTSAHPTRPVTRSTDASQGNATQPNPTQNEPEPEPPTAPGADDRRQPMPPVQASTPEGPTPAQSESARRYAQTLDQIEQNGGALNMNLANSLRRYGKDPQVIRLADRIRKNADQRQRVYDNGGLVDDTAPGGPRLERNDVDPKKVEDFARNHRPASEDDVRSDGNHKLGGVHDGHEGILGLVGGGDPVDGVPVKDGYTWQDDKGYSDDDVPYWLPQGIDGQDHKQVVSWYSKDSDGGPAGRGRVSFVDRDKGTYRNVLLVEPKGDADYAPVKTHAGGVAQQGKHMYVADTTGGLTVFDTTKMVHADGKKEAGGYKYVLPKVGSYDNVGGQMLFSSLSVDRSVPGKPALVVTEYRNDDDEDTAGPTHVVRWELGPGGRLKHELPSARYVTKRDQMQGGAMDHGKAYLSSSDPAGSGGALYSGRPGHGLNPHPWGDSPESLYVQNGLLWSLSEEPGHRAVYGSPLAEN